MCHSTSPIRPSGSDPVDCDDVAGPSCAAQTDARGVVHVRHDPYATLLVGLTIGLCIVVLSAPTPASLESPPAGAVAGVDPNTAPWWELTALPRVGETTARRIVDYRETTKDRVADDCSAAVFAIPADLTAVSGIGPKTVQRLATYLVFNPPSAAEVDSP